ncbi:hypothetical protein D3C80_2090100 [compost metagenome]
MSTLHAKACHRDLISSETLDVYARRRGKLDRQDKLIMVRIYADPHHYIRSREDAVRIQEGILDIVTGIVRPMQVRVEIVTTPTAPHIPQ